MASVRLRRSSRHVLRYTKKGESRDTVRRHFLRWRQEQSPPLPIRCDNPGCFFHTNPLTWNGKPLKPILDHVDGNNSDNRSKMLRLLCPNCDSQLTTRGGGNKGRIDKEAGGFAKVSRDGLRAYVMPTEGGPFTVDPSGSTGKARSPSRPRPLAAERGVVSQVDKRR
jgi:hypothetical protein